MKLPAWAFGVGAGDDTPISLTVRPGLHLDGPAFRGERFIRALGRAGRLAYDRWVVTHEHQSFTDTTG